MLSLALYFIFNKKWHYSFGKGKTGCFALMDCDNKTYYALSGYDYNYFGDIFSPSHKNENDKLISEIKDLNPDLIYAPLKDNAVTQLLKVKIPFSCGVRQNCDVIRLDKLNTCIENCHKSINKKEKEKLKDLYNCCEKMLISNGADCFECFTKKQAIIRVKWKPCKKRGCQFILSKCPNLQVFYLFKDYSEYERQGTKKFCYIRYQ